MHQQMWKFVHVRVRGSILIKNILNNITVLWGGTKARKLQKIDIQTCTALWVASIIWKGSEYLLYFLCSLLSFRNTYSLFLKKKNYSFKNISQSPIFFLNNCVVYVFVSSQSTCMLGLMTVSESATVFFIFFLWLIYKVPCMYWK